jgi:hypothetical protein
MQLAISGFVDHPLIGNGLGAANEMIGANPLFQRQFDVEKHGVDSWLLRILYEQGILVLIPIGVLYCRSVKRYRTSNLDIETARSASEAYAFACGLLFSYALLSGYRDLLGPWTAFAFLLGGNDSERRELGPSGAMRMALGSLDAKV